MASPLPYTPPNLPPHCVPETPVLVWLSLKFGTCLPSYLSLASTTCGIISIVAWLFAQMPQVWKNYHRSSVEGLSAGFLSIWYMGDLCNLLGAIWTDQMWFQQAVALYYVSIDTVLASQYLYYTYLAPPNPAILYSSIHYDESIDDDGDSNDSYLIDSDCNDSEPKRKQPPKTKPPSRSRASSGRSRSLASTLIVVVSLMCRLAGASPISPASSDLVPSPEFSLRSLGTLLSWFSTFLYLSSRLPQLYLNFRRRSTSGLAISLFAAAFCGNFFYSLSLLLNPLGWYDLPAYGGGGITGPEGNEKEEWWGRTLPFFLGAAGVLCQDAAVGWQWVCWGEGEGQEQEDCGEGRQWWPWNGWFEDSEGEEERKLLNDPRLSVGYGSGESSRS
ncbi:PQ loop repeat protein [Pyronema domesticum]|uniref:Similar to PQ-loop repeat-containing protein 2 acc. no. Q6ZP29 n=1 Tax=Pyronema omphalodes (strain CBS 100304) TaxID=1076935 RepID=U4LIW8_PYROM|nr:PQ loop repeat protein [Pyronema domesticum]CCX16679.1 Similar to PQ-loop repeat-containing protein 2; acc. no. Q6ZP29 [Pyronema omphalodes CBS 100304]